MCVPCFKFVRLGLTSFEQKEKGKVIELIFYCVLLLLLPSIICPKHNNVALPIKLIRTMECSCMRSGEKKLFAADNGLLGCISVPAVVLHRITESF